jgi:hypothetical protein
MIWALGHDDILAGHAGITTTSHRIRSAITWPGVTADLKRLSSACSFCQKLRAQPPTPADMSSTRAQHPFQSVFADYLGPLRNSDGYKYILVMICRFSHWVELVPTRDTTAQTTTRLSSTTGSAAMEFPPSSRLMEARHSPMIPSQKPFVH